HPLDSCALPSFPTRRSSDLPSTHNRAERETLRGAQSTEPSKIGCAGIDPAVMVTRHCSVSAHSYRKPRLWNRTQKCPLTWSANGDRKSTRLNSSHDQISYAV